MNLLSRHQCKIGMEVELIDPKSCYPASRTNPTKGSVFECSGIIAGISCGGDDINKHSISIDWKNGTKNCYRNHELSLLKDTGIYHSIW